MSKLYFSVLCLFLLNACQEKTELGLRDVPLTPIEDVDLTNYPEALRSVFAKHGGLSTWKVAQSLQFEIVKDEGNEKHFIHLKDRRERIEASNFVSGFDGKDIWLEADSTYKGNPAFYHNLMFYFYAMPFVLSDDGITYSDADTLLFEGKSYPGVKIAFQEDVGGSPKDEYYLHYDQSSHQMAWLGYTSTYHSQERSDNVNWIRYDDWHELDGLVLPQSITWYQVKDGKATQPRNTATFAAVSHSNEDVESGFFERTPSAILVE